MNLIIPLGTDIYPSERIGNKFANLSKISKIVNVPASLCVTVDVFRNSLNEIQISFLKRYFEELKATVGSFLIASYPELYQMIEGLKLDDVIRKKLKESMESTFGTLDGKKFAVRSSGVSEDSGTHSFAGVYKSILNVEGFDGICNAIVECWKSYYSYSAIAARIRAQQFDSDPSMALIIQEMVSAELAGVAFTDGGSDDVVIEYVEGLGEKLVSGAEAAKRFSNKKKDKVSSYVSNIMQRVTSDALCLQEEYGGPIDMEWAWVSGRLYILQVRPVTKMLNSNLSSSPIFRTESLYLHEKLPEGMGLGDCREVYISYVSKRAPVYRLAITDEVPVPNAFIVQFNGSGLLRNQLELEALLDIESNITHVVLDISSHLRQIIVPKRKVFEYLKETFSLNHNSEELHTVIIREFLQGQYGFISRLSNNEDNTLLVEYSSDGLLNINRGIAHCKRFTIKDVLHSDNYDVDTSFDQEEVVEEFRNALPTIYSFTKLINEYAPGTQVEWVLEQGKPYFIDFSREQEVLHVSENADNLMISAGVTQGPVLNLTNEEMLYKLSVGPAVSVDKVDTALEHEGLKSLIHQICSMEHKPIIVAQRPYAILSVLFEYVAGFVFLEGSLLCHLGILLRENRIPAVIVSNFSANDGDWIIMADGLVQPGRALSGFL